MKDRVVSLLKNFGIQESALTDSVHFTRDLGLDSLDTVDLIMQLEQEFSIRIPDEDQPRLMTLRGVIDYLEQEQTAVSV
ncbi:MAG: phosphopantetheine-binding protein [Bacteroidetes bacterium]|nr:phosphopantetheine-binding protein [Fibrella sp.]